MTRKEEQKMWQTYWKLRFNPKKTCTEEERQMYNTAGHLFYTEKYTNNKGIDGFNLELFRRLLDNL